jgi:hypothetical protein
MSLPDLRPRWTSPSRKPTSTAPNTYFICLSYQDTPIAWDPFSEEASYAPAYVRNVVRTASRQLDASGLTIYLTWRLDRLPSYGSDVVAIVMGDEWCRYPLYADRVLATFKCYGVHLDAGPRRPWFRYPAFNALIAGKYLRTQIHRLPGAFTRARSAARRLWRGAPPVPPVYDLPLGYGNQAELPIRPIANRSYDLFFAGSIQHSSLSPWSPRYYLQSPKTVSRREMVHQLHQLHTRRPDLSIRTSIASEFAWNALFYGTDSSSQMLDTDAYSEVMMNTKLCLVPRGTSLETFRYFEALRYGCIPVVETLPSRPYYDDAPVLEIESWDDLPEVVDTAFASPDVLQRMHEAALRWWDTRCSERVIGQWMAQEINRLRT